MNQNLTIRLFQISNGIQYLTSFICISLILFFKGTKIYGEFAILLQYAGIILAVFSLYTPASVLKQYIILDSSVKNKRNYLNEISSLMIKNIILFFLISMLINFFGYSLSMSLALFLFLTLSTGNFLTPLAYKSKKSYLIPIAFIVCGLITVIYTFICSKYLDLSDISRVLVWSNIIGLTPNIYFIFLLFRSFLKENDTEEKFSMDYFKIRPTNKKLSLYLNELLIFIYHKFDGIVLAGVSSPEVFAIYSVLWKSIEAPQFIIGNINNYLCSTDYYENLGKLAKEIEPKNIIFKSLSLKRFEVMSKLLIRKLKKKKFTNESVMLLKAFFQVTLAVIFLLIYFSKNTSTNLLVFLPFIIVILLIIFLGLCACSVLLALNNTRILLLRSVVGGGLALLTAPILVTKYGLLGSIISTLIAQFGSLVIPTFVNYQGMSTLLVVINIFVLNIPNVIYTVLDDFKKLLNRISLKEKI